MRENNISFLIKWEGEVKIIKYFITINYLQFLNFLNYGTKQF